MVSMATSLRCIGNICILSTTTQTPFITNCLVNIVHTKPVNSNFSFKIGCHGNVPQHLCTRIQHMIPIRSIRAHNPNGIPIGSAVFAHTTVVSLYFTLGRPFSLKTAPSHGGSGPPSNTWFPGSTHVLNPNGSSIGAAVFAGLTSVTDRPTDYATRSVRIGRIAVPRTWMRQSWKT